MEKSLKDTKDEVATLTERLNVSQAECNLRDEKIKTLIKQLELKTNELKNQPKKQRNLDNEKQGATTEELSERDNEINLLRVKLKRMEQEIKVLNRKLTKSGIEIQDMAAEITEISEEEKKNEPIEQENSNINPTELIENTEFKINDFEIKEIDVLKYKFEQDIIALKKDYETQLQQITIKVTILYAVFLCK